MVEEIDIGEIVVAKVMMEGDESSNGKKKTRERLIFSPLCTQSSCFSMPKIHSYLWRVEERYLVFIGSQS